MVPGKSSVLRALLMFGMPVYLVFFAGSCTIVKKARPDKAFIYKTNINLIGNFSNEQKDELETGLEAQLDDSLQSRKIDKLLWAVIRTPPVFDSVYADQSIQFMSTLLNTQGYFTDSIYYTYQIKAHRPRFLEAWFGPRREQLRTTIDFQVRPGVQVKLDSITYSLRDSNLQRLTDSSSKSTYLSKGEPFAKIPISVELDRLTELYRNNGYLRFNRDELVGVWDTLDLALLAPTLDPFEQLELLQQLRERRAKPTADLDIRLRSLDSLKLTQYYMGNITVYPDYATDTAGKIPRVIDVEGIRVIQYNHLFKPRIFPPNIYLPHGSLYRQARYSRTLNRLNGLGAWRMVSIDQLIRPGQDTVDFVLRMTPARKYSFNTNLEGSINQSAISGNLFGIGINAGIQNKNFARAANQATTNVRFGIELGSAGQNQFLQSQQISFNHNIFFPRFIFIPGFNPIRADLRDNWRTLFTFTAAQTRRRFLYNLSTLNGAWGYEYNRRKSLLTVKIPNIEYSFLVKKDSLDRLIAANPSLNNIFTTGFVASVVGNYTLTGGTPNRPTVLRLNFEESGLATGIMRNEFLDSELYRFVKMDVEFARLVRRPKSSFALRFFAGAGYEFNSTRNPEKRNSLPFFKQYFSGGPNSMRAWALRRLGPGSTIKDFIGGGGGIAANSFPDRYGDIQLEGNAEYRFPIGRPFGIKINGALFVDAGNVWYMKGEATADKNEVFRLSRLGRDIAIGAGGGLRVDFDFFVIRFDYAYKIKDPSPELINADKQNKWFGYPFFQGDQFQLGIGYPFIF